MESSSNGVSARGSRASAEVAALLIEIRPKMSSKKRTPPVAKIQADNRSFLKLSMSTLRS